MIGRLCSVLAVASAACVAGGAGATTTPGPIPLLTEMPSWSIERDTPPAVRTRIIREQQALLESARKAQALPRTAAAGCRPAERGILGPPTPAIAPRILGHHVEVTIAYASMPSSLACRPAIVDVVVYGGRKASSSYRNAVGHYLLRGPRSRVVLDVPWLGRPPYHVIVNSTSVAGVRGPTVERPLRCPGTGDTAAGCVPGYRPALHSWPMPAPVLPVRGLDRPTLEASFRYVLAGERWAPVARSSRCPTLRLCEATFIDPSFPRSPYRVRYRIAGEQIAGCWMGMKGAILDERPYDDASTGRLQLAGCSSWLR